MGRPFTGNCNPTPGCCSGEGADKSSPRRGLLRDRLHPSRLAFPPVLLGRNFHVSGRGIITPLLPTRDADAPAAKQAALPWCQLLHRLGLFLLPSSTASTLIPRLRRPCPSAAPSSHPRPPGQAGPGRGACAASCPARGPGRAAAALGLGPRPSHRDPGRPAVLAPARPRGRPHPLSGRAGTRGEVSPRYPRCP